MRPSSLMNLAAFLGCALYHERLVVLESILCLVKRKLFCALMQMGSEIQSIIIN
jgi:hypothetical protein